MDKRICQKVPKVYQGRKVPIYYLDEPFGSYSRNYYMIEQGLIDVLIFYFAKNMNLEKSIAKSGVIWRPLAKPSYGALALSEDVQPLL